MDCKHNDCCDIIDELLSTVESMGSVDYSQIYAYIDGKINEVKAGITTGEVSVDLNTDEIVAKVMEAWNAGKIEVKAKDVIYKNTTVAATLNKLTKVPFEGQISELRQYELGEVLHNVRIGWSFTKKLKSLSVGVYVNDQNHRTFELDPEKTSFEIPELSATTEITVHGVSIDNEELTLKTVAKFSLKYYVGCMGGTKIRNSQVISLSSYFADKATTKYSFVFSPIGKQYLWWIFPADLHTDYDFFLNGMLDSNYEWTTKNVKNEHGYTAPYIFIRTINPHTARNIYSEVIAHEHK